MKKWASTQLPSSKETDPDQNDTISQLISTLKSSFRRTDFDRVTDTLTKRDEAACKQISHWKAQFECVEKNHGEIALEKIIIEDELHKLKRERDFLKDQVARAEADEKESGDRERKWKERYEKLLKDFEMEKGRLGRRVSALEFEKGKAEWEAEYYKRRFEELNQSRRILRLEEDDAVLMSAGTEERGEKGVGPVAVAEMSDDVVVAGQLGMEGKVGRNGDENLTEPLVKESGSKCGEKAESLPHGGGSASVSVEAGGNHRENGITNRLVFYHMRRLRIILMQLVCF